MKLICQKCNKMPFIKLCYIEEGKIIVRINCKCGKIFHDISTFISEYTDINKEAEIHINFEKEEKIYKNEIIPEKNLTHFCETCFENIHNNTNENHKNHNLIKINPENEISKSELENKKIIYQKCAICY